MTEESKIQGYGIIPLRCECCYGSIEAGDGVVMLLHKVSGTHFVHSKCYDENDADYIAKRIEEMSNRTREDQKDFSNMESASADPNKNPA